MYCKDADPIRGFAPQVKARSEYTIPLFPGRPAAAALPAARRHGSLPAGARDRRDCPGIRCSIRAETVPIGHMQLRPSVTHPFILSIVTATPFALCCVWAGFRKSDYKTAPIGHMQQEPNSSNSPHPLFFLRLSRFCRQRGQAAMDTALTRRLC
jgi:hypothetical protein